MTESQFSTIKAKINEAELKSASSKGKMEAIESEWNSEYGFSSVSDAVTKLEELKKEKQEKEELRNSYMDKLEKSFDWDSI